MTRWIIDPDHSVACFAVRHMMISNVRGQFNRIAGSIEFDPPDLAGLSAEAEIDVSSIYTGIKKRDEHLLSPDFFDVEKHPKLTFRTTRVEGGTGNRCKVYGDLTMRGITRPVAFEIECSGPVKDPFDEGGMSIGFSAVTTIDREDFGISWNAPMNGGVVVGREIQVILEIEADRVSE